MARIMKLTFEKSAGQIAEKEKIIITQTFEGNSASKGVTGRVRQAEVLAFKCRMYIHELTANQNLTKRQSADADQSNGCIFNQVCLRSFLKCCTFLQLYNKSC